jgi:hypothetical protein
MNISIKGKQEFDKNFKKYDETNLIDRINKN